MRVLAFLGVLGVVFAGCATGTVPTDEGTADSGKDSGAQQDGSTPKQDGSTPKQDSGNPQKDSGTQPCGGQCLGIANTCCGSTCVDTTSDSNNCGGCNSPCTGSLSCCSSSCTDTMGSDTSNCGGCGVTCSGTCTNGTCQTQCTVDDQDQGCTHSVCTSGGALQEDCDINDDDITYYVCDFDFDGLTSCCTSTWDSNCVQDAQYWLQLFGESCNGC